MHRVFCFAVFCLGWPAFNLLQFRIPSVLLVVKSNGKQKTVEPVPWFLLLEAAKLDPFLLYPCVISILCFDEWRASCVAVLLLCWWFVSFCLFVFLVVFVVAKMPYTVVGIPGWKTSSSSLSLLRFFFCRFRLLVDQNALPFWFLDAVRTITSFRVSLCRAFTDGKLFAYETRAHTPTHRHTSTRFCLLPRPILASLSLSPRTVVGGLEKLGP